MNNNSDGIAMLLDEVQFAGTTIGYISEEGVEWGGESAEYVKVFAAQVRNAPVKKVKKKDATNLLTFNMIELLPDNCVTVMGGAKKTKGAGDDAKEYWEAPSDSVSLEGPVTIKCATGQVIEIAHASLDGAVRGKIGGDDPLHIACEMEILQPTDGGAPFTIE